MQILQQKHLLLYTVIAIMAAILLPMTLRHGMFVDGEIYSTIANNLANGNGTLWEPIYSGDIYSPFHEHPPLMFGIEAIFFNIFGNSRFVDRWLTISFAFIAAILLIRIWRTLFGKQERSSWVVVLFWFLTPIVFWSFSNNMLENLITITYLLGLYSAIRYTTSESYKFRWLIYVVVSTIAGVLIKGPVGLLPLCFPFILNWQKKGDLKKSFLAGLVVVITFIALFILLLQIPGLKNNLRVYYDTQLTGSLSGERVVVHRTYVLERLFMEILPALLLFGLYFVLRIKKFSGIGKKNKHLSIKFLLIGFAAVLPIMISPKQLMFYVVPAIPFFILSMVCLVKDKLEEDVSSLFQKKDFKKVLLLSSTLITLLAIILAVRSLSIYSRDKQWYDDIEKVGERLDPGEELQIHSSLKDEWSVFAVFQRYHGISCYRNTPKDQMIAEKSAKVGAEWKEIELGTKLFRYYVKN